MAAPTQPPRPATTPAPATTPGAATTPATTPAATPAASAVTKQVKSLAPMRFFLDNYALYDPNRASDFRQIGCNKPLIFAKNWQDADVEPASADEKGRIGAFVCEDSVEKKNYFFFITKKDDNTATLYAAKMPTPDQLKKLATGPDNLEYIDELPIDQDSTKEVADLKINVNEQTVYRMNVEKYAADVLKISGVQVYETTTAMNFEIKSYMNSIRRKQNIEKAPEEGENKRLLTNFRMRSTIGAVLSFDRYNKLMSPPPLSILGEPITLTGDRNGFVTEGYGLYIRYLANPFALLHPAAGLIDVGAEMVWVNDAGLPKGACVGRNDCSLDELYGGFLLRLTLDAEYFRAVLDEGVPVSEPERQPLWNVGAFAELVLGGRMVTGKVNQDGSSHPRSLDISNFLYGGRFGIEVSAINLGEIANLVFSAYYEHIPGIGYYNR